MKRQTIVKNLVIATVVVLGIINAPIVLSKMFVPNCLFAYVEFKTDNNNGIIFIDGNTSRGIVDNDHARKLLLVRHLDCNWSGSSCWVEGAYKVEVTTTSPKKGAEKQIYSLVLKFQGGSTGHPEKCNWYGSLSAGVIGSEAVTQLEPTEAVHYPPPGSKDSPNLIVTYQLPSPPS